MSGPSGRSGVERRKHVRFNRPVTALMSAAGADEPRWDMVVAQDISLGGMRFYCDRFYTEGTLLNFRFPVSGQPLPEERLGVVVRLSAAADIPLHRIAVRFEGSAPAFEGGRLSRFWAQIAPSINPASAEAAS